MRLLLASLILAPALAFAAGEGDEGNESEPPARTKTTQDCFSERQWDPDIKRYVRYSAKVNGVWDPQAQKCIRPDKASSVLDPDTVYGAVRELAYAGRHEDAQTLLSGMDQNADRVMTYWGFTHRKLGNVAQANAFYERAIADNPDNLLARSYMGQGFVEAGETEAAIAQWHEIMARGGEGSWAETSLRNAIRTGETYSF
jgi:tetratricopeptide (TPR) repeat protein